MQAQKESKFIQIILILAVLSISFFYSYICSDCFGIPDKLFEASVGLITFLSVFYAFVIMKDKNIFETAQQKLAKEIKRKETETLNNLTSKNWEKDINSLKKCSVGTRRIMSYLEVDKWILIGVLSFLSSIGFYLTGSKSPLLLQLQVLSFWIGFLLVTVIVLASFVCVKINKKN